VLASVLFQPEIAPSLILPAYISGYVGIMLSPTYLCLILTNDYFKAPVRRQWAVVALPVKLSRDRTGDPPDDLGIDS